MLKLSYDVLNLMHFQGEIVNFVNLHNFVKPLKNIWFLGKKENTKLNTIIKVSFCFSATVFKIYVVKIIENFKIISKDNKVINWK